MNILITGVAGFIGSCLAREMAKDHKVYGIDNLNNYYSVNLKIQRLKNLKKLKNFYFKKIDINSDKKLNGYLKKKKIDIIYHLAAQAGVRYSFEKPDEYIDNNIKGFFNIIKVSKIIGVKKIIYASSSSVYGDSKKFPLNEKQILRQKNIYAVSKMINEQTAEFFSKIINIKFIGIRFFTIYGPWGRPDMLLFKLFKSFEQNKYIEINNKGNHYRDFTYIEDAIVILKKLLQKNYPKHEIFNICSNNPVNISKLVKNFKKKKFLKVKYVKKHRADVFKTHGDNKKIIKSLKVLKFSNFEEKFWHTFDWYKKNKIDRV
tara:strand:+ start:334 stop:1284 length:951 start_codon:yes stop_codon:yes gene_type:complete